MDAHEAATAWSQAEDLLAKSENLGIHPISRGNSQYPSALEAVKDAPLVLWWRGCLDAIATAAIAVVGTRHPSPTGATVARRTGQRLVREGITVVSGLAIGCDTEAHLGTVAQRGIGVGVLAHGLDDVRPASNRRLAEQLLDAGGAPVSEYALGVPARPQNFVHRNRIQVGLSEAVLVVETGRKGGTMHTVDFARGADRLVAVWGAPSVDDAPLADDSRAGNRALLRDSTTMRIETPDDLSGLAAFVKDIHAQRGKNFGGGFS